MVLGIAALAGGLVITVSALNGTLASVLAAFFDPSLLAPPGTVQA